MLKGIVHPAKSIVLARIFSGIITALLLSSFCFSQISVTVSPKSGPPTTQTKVSGSGFTADAAIDIYFDGTLETSTTANSSGAFSNVAITIPAAATPGKHVVSARISGSTAGRTHFLVNTNWSMFGFTPAGGRWNPYENQLSTSTVGELSLAWSYTTGGLVTCSPAVVDGVVYVSSNDNNLYALDASSGTKLWSFANDGSTDFLASSPAVFDGVVYIGSSDGLYALNASSGAEVWSFAARGGVISSPVVVNRVVYLQSYYDDVYALDAKTGAELWSFPTGSHLGGASSSPAVADGVVYVGSADKNVYALNAANGAELWSFKTGYYVTSSPAVADGVVYIGSSDFNVYALSAATGAKLWSFKTSAYVYSSPAVANGVVYAGDFGCCVYALDAATGAELWSFVDTATYGSPTVANGVVYIGFYDRNVYALDADTGTELWSYPTGGNVDSSPTVANGTVFVGSLDNNVYAFGLPASEDAANQGRAGSAEMH